MKLANMFNTLLEGQENIEKRFKKNILKKPGSKYWKKFKIEIKI